MILLIVVYIVIAFISIGYLINFDDDPGFALFMIGFIWPVVLLMFLGNKIYEFINK